MKTTNPYTSLLAFATMALPSIVSAPDTGNATDAIRSSIGHGVSFDPDLFASLIKPSDVRFPTLKVDSYVEGWMERRHIPGVAVGVLRAGKVQFIKGYGKADVSQKTPVTENTLFEIASNTKQFTAFGILCLANDGKLKLDDPICKHISVPSQFSTITIRQLLTHTSGLQDYTAQPEFADLMTRNPSKDEIKSLILSKPPQSKPGERWEYNNSGYYLAGLIIENCSKKNYYDYLKEKIFVPLNMHHTGASGTKSGAQMAEGLEWNKDQYKPSTIINNTLLFSAGGLVSTVGDMLKWQEALDSNEILPAQYRNELWRRVKLNDGNSPNNVKLFNDADKLGYGMGWFIKPDGDTETQKVKWAAHYGLSWGFSSYIVKNPNEDLTIVILTNREAVEDAQPFFTPSLLAEGIARVCAPDSIRPNHVAPIKNPPNQENLGSFKECLESLRLDKVQEDKFSAEFWNKFNSQVPDYCRFVTSLGKPKAISLVSEKDEEGAVNSSYKVEFKDSSWIFEFGLSSKGKILQFAAVQEVD